MEKREDGGKTLTKVQWPPRKGRKNRRDSKNTSKKERGARAKGKLEAGLQIGGNWATMVVVPNGNYVIFGSESRSAKGRAAGGGGHQDE